MVAFIQSEVEDQYRSLEAEREAILEELETIIRLSGTPLEGNSFYHHTTLNLYPELYTKQLNLFWCGQQATTKICEIGFNAGHSTMLMLLGRPKTPLNFTIFDIGRHAYTRPCLTYMNSQFPHAEFEYVVGDSTVTVPNWIDAHMDQVGTYDVVHVDGGHNEPCMLSDTINADILLKSCGIMIIDDTNCDYINRRVDAMIASGHYTELGVLKTAGYPHRILRKV
jgi:hypothetical protein